MLPNGLRLIVQPEHVSHTVSVFGRVRQVPAMQEPPGKEGIASLMRGLFEYGTEAHDRIAFREAVDAIAAEVTVGPAFSLRVLTPAFQDGMRLLAENELHPAFPPDAFTVVRAQVAQKRGRPVADAGLSGAPGTEAGDRPGRRSNPATIHTGIGDGAAAAGRARVLCLDLPSRPHDDRHRRRRDRRAGAPRGKRHVRNVAGSRCRHPTSTCRRSPPASLLSTRVPDSDSLQDRVTLAETLALPVTSPDRYTLMLGNVILGSGFTSRLYQDLRIRTGYVYSVGSNLDWSRSRADYSVSFGADTENVEKARQLILRDLRDMQTTPVSARGTDPREGRNTAQPADAARQYRRHRRPVSPADRIGPPAGFGPACSGALPVDHRA